MTNTLTEAVSLVATPEWLFVASLLSFCLSFTWYWQNSTEVGQSAAMVGFVMLAALFTLFLATYVRDGRWDLAHYAVAAVGGIVLSLRSVVLVASGWDRSGQLVTATVTLLLVLLPFELFPAAMAAFQEIWTVHLVELFGQIGIDTTRGQGQTGELTRITFGNGGYIEIVRECTGIDAVALFGGTIAAARVSARQKLATVVFLFVAVYLVNVSRILFVGTAIAGDWFGPYLTDGQTLLATYYIAEVLIGQLFVVTASVVGFLAVGRWLPDVVAFGSELLGVRPATAKA